MLEGRQHESGACKRNWGLSSLVAVGPLKADAWAPTLILKIKEKALALQSSELRERDLGELPGLKH